MRGLTLGLAALRATGAAALLVLIWNPVTSHRMSGNAPPLVLLDASLSMNGAHGRWRRALDTARALAKGGVIWRFGTRIAAFDSAPPTDGSTRLAPALDAAAARGGDVVVVTDGAIDDASSTPADLVRDSRVVVIERAPFRDAFVAAVDGAHRIAIADTFRLNVSYGVAGPRATGPRSAALAVFADGRRLTSKPVDLPDSGTVATDIELPAARVPHAGWSALEVRLEGARDSEPRDDARLFVAQVSPAPSIVVLASPPNWDLQFLARTLSDVTRVPLTMFVRTKPSGGDSWRDANTLAPVAAERVKAAVAAARLVVVGGDPAQFEKFPTSGAALLWPTLRGQDGDWYVDDPPATELTPALAGVAWDSLPPAASVLPVVDSGLTVALGARASRRGSTKPIVLLSERGGVRRVEIAATGLYRWAFRGGAATEAYRALVAALADWLMKQGTGSGERVAPVAYEASNGMPVVWRWTGATAARDVVVTVRSAALERRDTLRFDAGGRSEQWLPPGVYRYQVQGGAERGMVAVDTYSDEWRPTPSQLTAHAGASGARLALTPARDRWWLFVLVVLAFSAEWAWRRRQGLP